MVWNKLTKLNRQPKITTTPAGGGNLRKESLSLTERADELCSSGEVKTKPLDTLGIHRKLNSITLLKYLSLSCLALAIISTIGLNLVRSYSTTNTLANARQGGDAATLANNTPAGPASIKLSITNATGGADTQAANISIHTPDGGGVATGRHTISIISTSVSGYTLAVEGNGGDETDLTPPGFGTSTDSNNTVIRSVKDPQTGQSASLTNPQPLSDLEWGIAIPTGNAGYTPVSSAYNAESDYSRGLPAAQGGANGGVENAANQTALLTTKYAAVPTKTNASTILSTAQPSGANHDGSTSDNFNIYYGVRIDDPGSTIADTYSAQVTYTAVAILPPEATLTSVSPVSYTMGYSADDTLTINGTNLAGAYQAFIDLDADGQLDNGEECTGVSVVNDGQITCHVNTNYTGKTHSYDVYVYTQASATPARLVRGFTYINSICRSGDSNNDCQVDVDSNMIPVRYTGTTSRAEWTSIANAEDANNIGQWYDYRQQKWANAVTVEPDKLSKYQGKDTVIDEEDVLGYWVYVPRYSYEVQRLNATDHYVDNSDFSIVFEKTTDLKKSPAASCNSTDPTVSQMWTNGIANNAASNIAAKDYRTGCGLDRSYPSNDVANLNIHNGGTTWTTHPAFTFGDTELNGFWVGKFELTGSQSAPTVKPNEFANISEPIGDFYDTIKSIGQPDTANTGGNGLSLATNQHNLSTYKSNMMKNDEWGATAYLSASQFGARVNKVYNNAARIWYYKDSNGLYQMYKDADGQNVDQCYYSKRAYNASSNSVTSTDTGIGCFRDANGNVVSSNGVSLNTSYTYTYTTNANGDTAQYTSAVNHWGGNHTGCGPNNSSGSVTAYESCEPNSDHSYQGSIGQLASTTNNVYGVYDMAGGDWEYVAANITTSDNSTQTNSTSYMKNQSNGTYFNLFRTSDGFDRTTAYGANGEGHAPAWSVKYGGANSTNSQPWRVYMYNNDFCQWGSCGGQAMHETKRYQSVNDWNRSWGSDDSDFPNVTNPWLIRGGRVANGSGAGVFASNYSNGGTGVGDSSRAVLAGR